MPVTFWIKSTGSWFLLCKFSCLTSFVFSSSKGYGDFQRQDYEGETTKSDAYINRDITISKSDIEDLDYAAKTEENEEEKIEIVRKIFPETWIWDLVTMG